jgi:hypothetical protein
MMAIAMIAISERRSPAFGDAFLPLARRAAGGGGYVLSCTLERRTADGT